MLGTGTQTMSQKEDQISLRVKNQCIKILRLRNIHSLRMCSDTAQYFPQLRLITIVKTYDRSDLHPPRAHALKKHHVSQKEDQTPTYDLFNSIYRYVPKRRLINYDIHWS